MNDSFAPLRLRADPLHAILFDFYDTLGTRAQGAAAIEIEALRSFGYEYSAGAIAEASRRAWAPFDGALDHSAHSASAEQYLAWRSEIDRVWLTELGIDPCPEDVLTRVSAASDDPGAYRLFDDVPGALTELRRRGYGLGVVSNWGWELPAIFEHAGLAGALDLLITSARCGYRKPHPEIYRCALRQLALAPSQVLFVGDNPEADIAGPAAAGMRALLIDRTEVQNGGVGCVANLEVLLGLLPEQAGEPQ